MNDRNSARRVRHVETLDEVMDIAAEILGARPKPLVLISTADEGASAYDPEFVQRELGDLADVVTIATGSATYQLEFRLPPRTHVYGGAARAYPDDFGKDPAWERSVLRFPDRHGVEQLIEDTLAQFSSHVDGTPLVRQTWAKGIVERVSGETGNVARLENGEQVMIVGDRIDGHLPLSEALIVGDPIEGWLIGRDLAPEYDADSHLRFEDGVITLARVTKVTERRAYLRLHPTGTEYPLRRRDLFPGIDDGENADADARDLVSVGQTVRVRVINTSDGFGLSLMGVDPDAPLVPSVPLLTGGAPWLREGVDAEPASEPVASADEPEAPAAEPEALVPSKVPVVTRITPKAQLDWDNPEARPVTSADLHRVRDELRELRSAFGRLGGELRSGTDLETLDWMRAETVTLNAELQRERIKGRQRDATISDLQRQLREARAARPIADRGRTGVSAWPTGEEWVRHEVMTTWAERTSGSDKKDHPLPSYDVGPEFVDTMTALDDAQLEKALRAVVDVLTGRAPEIAGRQLHRLREGAGGADAYVTRADGASCWRVAIEVGTPSARRLHYWQQPGGRLELSRVVLHGDMTP